LKAEKELNTHKKNVKNSFLYEDFIFLYLIKWIFIFYSIINQITVK